MAKALREGGLYYTEKGKAVDAEGNEVKDAPKQPKNTDPSKQPGALGAATPEERMGVAIAQAILNPKAAVANAGVGQTSQEGNVDENESGQEQVELPTLADLPDHLQSLNSVEEVEKLQNSDDRKGAVSLYEARLAELRGE